MSDPFCDISVGDVRRAVDSLRAFLDEGDRAGRTFMPEDFVACVLDSIRKSAVEHDAFDALMGGDK